jgi:hypothetical protein
MIDADGLPIQAGVYVNLKTEEVVWLEGKRGEKWVARGFDYSEILLLDESMLTGYSRGGERDHKRLIDERCKRSPWLDKMLPDEPASLETAVANS